MNVLKITYAINLEDISWIYHGYLKVFSYIEN